MQLQEHQPQQRVQRRQRERRDQRQGQERQRERREDSPRREQRGTRETIQETGYRMDRGNQTDASQPFIYPEPQAQLLPFLSDFISDSISWIPLSFAALCLGFLIGQVVKWRAPRANEALDLAIRVFALEAGRFLFKPVNQLMKFWAYVVSTYGGFWEYVLFLVMLTILIAHYGQMYILREEYALLVLYSFLLPSLCFLLVFVRWHYLANRFL